MSGLATAIAASLDELGWDARPQDSAPDEEHHFIVEWRAGGDDDDDDEPDFPIVLVVHDRLGVVVIYSVAPFDVPTDQRLAVAVYLTMANHGLLLGNFELDLSDGEVRYKSSLRAAALADLTAELREQLRFNLGAFNAYLAGLIDVATGELDPSDAIARIEGTHADAAEPGTADGG